MNPNGVRDPGNDQFGEPCSEAGHVDGCPGMAGGDHELEPIPLERVMEHECEVRLTAGPKDEWVYRFPMHWEVVNRVLVWLPPDEIVLNGAGSYRPIDVHSGERPFVYEWIALDAPDPDWFEDDEGFVRAPLSYENREGDPAFNGAFDRW